VQDPSQQTPSTQLPVAQSAAALQAWPLILVQVPGALAPAQV
jgi:hypothetical protein